MVGVGVCIRVGLVLDVVDMGWGGLLSPLSVFHLGDARRGR